MSPLAMDPHLLFRPQGAVAGYISIADIHAEACLSPETSTLRRLLFLLLRHSSNCHRVKPLSCGPQPGEIYTTTTLERDS